MKEEKEKYSWWKEGIHIVCITLLALLMTRFIINDLSSLSLFAPIEKQMDFEISDVYNAVEESRPIHAISPNVVMVSIDSLPDRAAVLDIVNFVALAGPKAIALDAYFKISQADNTYLLNTMKDITNLVGATQVVPTDSARIYRHKDLNFFEGQIPAKLGYINVDTDASKKVVRTFHPFVLDEKGDTLKSMVMMVASIADKARVDELLARGNEVETIDFISYEIPIVPAARLNEPAVYESLRDKVVVIGSEKDKNDWYITPLHGSQPGMLIHAYAIQTILNGSYIEVSTGWLNWLIAVVICMIFVGLLLLAKRRMSNIGSLFTRIGQFLILYFLVAFGCWMFARAHVYVDFAPALLMLALGGFAFAIWFAAYGTGESIVKYIKNKLHKS